VLGHNNPPPPTLTSRDHASHARQDRAAQAATRWPIELDETGRWALLKTRHRAMRIADLGAAGEDPAAELGGRTRMRSN